MSVVTTSRVLVGIALSIGAWGVAVAAPGPDAYGGHAAISNLRISPDGQYVAMMAAQGDADVVVISKIGGGSCRIGAGANKLRGVIWANNERLLVEASVASALPNNPGEHRLYEWFQTFSVNTNCADARKMPSDPGLAQQGTNYLGIAPDGEVLMSIGVYNENTEIEARLRRMKTTDFKVNIYKINATTGNWSRYEEGADRTYRWIVDRTGKARLRIDWDDRVNRSIVSARIGDSDDWVQVYDGRATTDPDQGLAFVGLSRTPDTAYVMGRNGGDRVALYEFNLRTRSLGRVVFQHPRVDVGGLVSGGYAQEPLGISYVDDYTAVDYFDRDFAQMQADLNVTFPGEHAYVVSVSKDHKHYIAAVEGATNPGGVFYFVDMTAPAVSVIGARHPGLTPADIGPVTRINYAARDGMSIPAYLTLPYGSPGKNIPLVVMPHGGPEARDDASFDAWSAFLASRGYAVLRPQFRGSDGFGLRHRNAGRRQWGLAIQNDISDGVKYLISTGVADPARVCIVGWSFGGYAAEAGLAFSPELYRCGVSGAGVSDLVALLEDESKSSGRWFRDNDQITMMIGSARGDRERLLATSPAQHAANFRAPLLLIHGRDDTVVPKSQSDMMAAALKAAGKPYEYVEIDGEDHWLSRGATGKRFLQELERFLGAQLK